MKMLLPAILFGVSLTLGAAIAYEAVAPLDPVTVEKPRLPSHRAPAAVLAVYAPPSEDLFTEIDARPLFSTGRKPLQDVTQANASAAGSDFVLVGVIMGGDRAVALLRNKTTSATVSAALGDVVNGWRVTKIAATTVTLRSAAGDFVVPLDGPANAPPSQPLQAAPSSQPPQSSAPPPAAPAAAPPATAPAQTAAAATPPKPVAPGHKPTIAPEALKGAPIDPTTGEPTL